MCSDIASTMKTFDDKAAGRITLLLLAVNPLVIVVTIPQSMLL